MKDAIVATTFLNAVYPGGLEKFLEDRGGVLYLPEPANLLVFIVNEGMDKAFIERLAKTFPQASVETGLNFEDTYAEINEIIEALFTGFDKPMAYQNSPIALVFSLPSVSKKDPALKQLSKEISTLPGLRRAFIITNDGYRRIDGSSVAGGEKQAVTVSSKAQVQAVSESKPKRESVIDDIDVALLQKSLDSMSVDDFIASM